MDKSEFKGTSGKWEVLNKVIGAQSTHNALVVHSSESDEYICLISPEERLTEKDLANAQLIVCSKKLLHTCQMLLEHNYISDENVRKEIEDTVNEALSF